MKQQTSPLASAAALLLAAAALPLTPLTAQETSPPADPPVVEAPVPETQAPVEPVIPVATDPAPAATTSIPAEAEPVPVRTTTTRTTTRTTRAPARVVAPAPVTVAPVTVAPVPVETLPPVATLPPPVAQTPPAEILPETTTTTADAPLEDNRDSFLPWLLAGLLLVGALAFFALRRRRRTAIYDEVYEPAHKAAPVVEPAVAAVPAAAPVGRPELDLSMRPVRAGVSGDDARVEFELTVSNGGTAPAEDVRISTWLLPAGTSEAEQALIEPRDHADTPPVTIAAGEARTVEAAVALPTAGIAGDALLPMVVALARYQLPEGGEGRVTARFAVGVPDGEELAHFGIDNPSGLHEDVVARQLGESERA